MVKVYSDGSCRNLKGGNQPMGAGVMVEVDGEEYARFSYPLKSLGNSNVAEYKAFILALKSARKIVEENFLYDVRITFHLDSRFVVNQVTTSSWVGNEEYRKLKAECLRQLAAFNRPVVRWVPRTQNRVADEMAGLARKEAIKIFS